MQCLGCLLSSSAGDPSRGAGTKQQHCCRCGGEALLSAANSRDEALLYVPVIPSCRKEQVKNNKSFAVFTSDPWGACALLQEYLTSGLWAICAVCQDNLILIVLFRAALLPESKLGAGRGLNEALIK